MRVVVQIALALLVLSIGALGLWAMIEYRPVAEVREQVPVYPLVRAEQTVARTVHLDVESHGTVRPRTQIQLVSEVAGRVVWVSPSLWAGGFFDAGEELIKIEERDFELQVTAADAEVAQAKLALALEDAEAEAARGEWEKLQPGVAPSPLTVREPHLAQARTRVAAAEAMLAKAKLDLERATLRAPFAGRATRKNVDVGQYVGRGVVVAELYAVDFAEVRLPLPDEEIAFLDLRLDATTRGPDVTISTEFAGSTQQWTGYLSRVEGEIDPRTRMVHVVARVEDPYDRKEQRDGPPLAAGMFVAARIAGRALSDVIVIPRSAVRDGRRVLVVERSADDGGTDDELPLGRLRFRDVDVLRFERERALVRGGLRAGDILCVTPLAEVVDGMRVRYTFAQPDGQAAPELETEPIGSRREGR